MSISSNALERGTFRGKDDNNTLRCRRRPSMEQEEEEEEEAEEEEAEEEEAEEEELGIHNRTTKTEEEKAAKER